MDINIDIIFTFTEKNFFFWGSNQPVFLVSFFVSAYSGNILCTVTSATLVDLVSKCISVCINIIHAVF